MVNFKNTILAVGLFMVIAPATAMEDKAKFDQEAMSNPETQELDIMAMLMAEDAKKEQQATEREERQKALKNIVAQQQGIGRIKVTEVDEVAKEVAKNLSSSHSSV
jgi:adenylosuccinate synthase